MYILQINPEKKLKKEHIKNFKKAIKEAQYFINELKTLNGQNVFDCYQKQASKDHDIQQKMTGDKNRPRPTRPRPRPPPPPPPPQPRPPNKTDDLDEKIRQGFENLVNFILSLY